MERLLGVECPTFYRNPDRLCAVFNAQPDQNGRAVLLHRARADIELLGNRLVGAQRGQADQHLALSRGQPGQQRARMRPPAPLGERALHQWSDACHLVGEGCTGEGPAEIADRAGLHSCDHLADIG